MIKAVMSYSGDFTLEDRHVEKLISRFPQVKFIAKNKKDLTHEDLMDANVFVGWPDDSEISSMPLLQWIQLPSAGADGYVNRATLKETVVVTTASGVFGVPGAEHALALMLALTRQLPLHMRQQSERIWRRNPYCLEVQDSVVTVIGMGDIGTEVARKAKGLGAYVVVVKRNPTDRPPFVDELCATADLDSALEKADFIVSALPLTAETQGIISAERIKRMKKGTVFINVGRGPTIDEQALIEALQSGHLEAAGLDVTEIEPLPASSPLWSMPNVLITSHSVGITPKKSERRTTLLISNLERLLKGEALQNTVVRSRGY